VSVVRHDGDFAWVRTSSGHEGFLKTTYLTKDSEGALAVYPAVHRRSDAVHNTALRKVATNSRSGDVFCDHGTCVKNGEHVSVVRHDGDFAWVRSSSGHEGFLQTKYLTKVSDADVKEIDDWGTLYKTIVWIDSDPSVDSSLLEDAGFVCLKFQNTLQAKKFLQHGGVLDCIPCVLTSSMKRDGRQEAGLPSGMDIIDFVVEYCTGSHKPLIAFITASADEQEVLERGVTIFRKYNRSDCLREIVRVLNETDCRDFRLVRKSGSTCSFEMRAFARSVADAICNFWKYHNAFADLCFCEQCEPKRLLVRAGERYALPTGWWGFGIHLREDFQKRRSEIENWHVAYHGTRREVVESILQERRIMFPGDVLKDGTKLKVAHAQCGAHLLQKPGGPKPPVIYVSPTINYASDPVYAKPFKYEGKLVQAVFQCRVKPGAYVKFHETLPGYWARHIDPAVRARGTWDSEFDETELEWISADKEAVVPYRLLLRWFDSPAPQA